ncbi:hypothetical protein RJ639_034659 [Escallonia herrerae]|uniref:AMP-dependent synthetase/ligase domain-containing protein n=1 Tax=Escallonia herrerae TaxID=1293975 RepID=A0AA88WZL5_9ASTE|nr:hypothetical protein RJ639_034659 [Escallonia herrerae]
MAANLGIFVVFELCDRGLVLGSIWFPLKLSKSLLLWCYGAGRGTSSTKTQSSMQLEDSRRGRCTAGSSPGSSRKYMMTFLCSDGDSDEGKIFNKKSEATFLSRFGVGLFMGKNHCGSALAFPYVGEKACLQENSLCYRNFKVSWEEQTKQIMSKTSYDILQAGISGGGSLPLHVDRFFEAIEVKVQNGYGLTESSPVVAARRPTCNVLGSIGHPLRHTEFKVVDAESGEVLPPGSKGILKVRGPQVMRGYYKNMLAMKQVLDEDGWLDTGDIGWIAPCQSVGRGRHSGGVVVLEGRAKDTIVLSTVSYVAPSWEFQSKIIGDFLGIKHRYFIL